MISSVNVLNQFVMKPSGVRGLPYLVPKSGSGSLKELFAQKAARDEERFRSLQEDVKKNGNTAHLTEEQTALLSAKYHANSMSYEEYRAFMDQLCEWGVFQQEDLPYLSAGPAGEILTPVDFSQPVATVTAGRPGRYFSREFSSSGGSVLDWAGYLSSFEFFNPDTQSFEKTGSALLFDRLRDVLEMIR